jgi:phenylacetate-coenzyme A ligase PaaK-like adenylate-forming protein
MDFGEWRMSMARRLVRRLKRKSRFYSGRLSDADESRLSSFSDMESLPFTYPEDVTANPEDFLCVPPRAVSRVTTVTTSGTTGKPKRMFFTDGDLARTVDFFRTGMKDVIGDGKSAAIMLSSNTSNSVAELLRRALAENGVEASVAGAGLNFREIAETVRGADCLIGIPSSLIKLCRAYPNLRPSSVLLTADYVPESIVRGIKHLWGCRSFTHYGMTETGFGCAVQCGEGEAHHIRHSDMIVEIVDPVTGRQSPPGVKGEITVTTFAHEAMPLLRYRTGDISEEIRGTCRCGGEYPRLGKIGGRNDNIIYGGIFDGIRLEQLDEAVYSFDGVLGYKVKSEADAAVRLSVDAMKFLDRPSFENAVKSMLLTKKEDRERVYFTYDYDVPFSSAAKRRIERY